MTLPRTLAPEWASSMRSPWDTVNKALRIHDVFCVKAIVASRVVTAPPGSCSDGDAWLVAAGATGDWYGEDGRLAISVGDNAANGWYFCNISQVGSELYVIDEAKYIEHNGSAWVFRADSISGLGDLPDVTLVGIADHDMLVYDASGQFFYPVSPTIFTQPPVITETGAEAELLPQNAGHYQRWTNASAKTLTVQPDATTAQPTDGEWHIRNVGAGDLTIAAGAGVTINAPNGGTLVVPQNGTVTLKRAAADEFDLLGQTVAA